ncbi:MAG: ribulose-phosphate 3-epimerase [Nitrospirae bacterium GWC2_42_7]|nr:MAG: ribulose-phosphate 3-epimerase [Nitrospirae bacterium GWC2_42_7]
MIKIAPSILSADFMRLGEEIKAVEDSGAHLLHLDIMDGHFVPNLTIGYSIVESIKKITKLPLDVHLMIEDPDKYLDNFINAGSDYLTVHFEACAHLHRTVSYIKEKGIKAGVSINPATPVSSLEEIVHDIDLIVLMSVNPGFGGQSFIPHTLEKAKRLRKMTTEKNLSILIEVDGGVKPENAKEVAASGADILVMGSAFFGSKDYSGLMKKLNEILGN